eukprot:5326743-Prorocentrum_lima.AAC.1
MLTKDPSLHATVPVPWRHTLCAQVPISHATGHGRPPPGTNRRHEAFVATVVPDTPRTVMS